jgi:hypothetical protein
MDREDYVDFGNDWPFFGDKGEDAIWRRMELTRNGIARPSVQFLQKVLT